MAKTKPVLTDSVLRIFSYSWMAWFALPILFLTFLVVFKSVAVSAVLQDMRFWYAFLISLAAALVVIILTPLFAIPTAYFLTYRNFRHQKVAESILIDIPQTFPPVAVGVIYLFAFGPNSPLNLAYTFMAVVIAKLFVSAPFTLSHTLRKFREIKQSKLDLVARSLGSDTKHLLFRVLIPLARNDIVAGLTLSWARAMGEFGGSLIFAGVIAYKTEILPTYTSRVVTIDPFLALAATLVLTFFSIL
ncbi:ABC transporter permease subunit, partial [Candidatus Woesearchaeota archaeon]|nr:ABC transporter permease subunit [Candidatus Woesearchaeota archaeon]